MKSAGTIKNLWRYPVKSMGGEACQNLQFDARGAVGDRLFAVRDAQGKFGSGKNTRRFVKIDGLLDFRARYDGKVPVITFPDGEIVCGDDGSVDAKLSEFLGQPVTLAEEESVSHFDAGSIHLVTTASLDWLKYRLPDSVIDERRFRPNIVVEMAEEALSEQNWLGKTLQIGENVRLEIVNPTERCVMTNFAQPGIPEDKNVFARIGREADLNFGVYAKVLSVGIVSISDEITII